MSFLSLFLAAGSLLPYVLAAPVAPFDPIEESSVSSRISTFGTTAIADGADDGNGGSAPHLEKRKDTYRVFMGAAESAAWPSMNEWVSSYDAMFNSNKGVMKQACKQWNVPNNSDQEINDIYYGIKQVAGETGVDARFILAVLMQESNGCVRVPTTNWGVRNPGLMQDHDGAATCNEGVVQNPCPSDKITQMIRDGVAGTPKGDGLVQLLQKVTGTPSSKYYKVARMYNSGSIDPSGHLEKGIATHCYVSDIANRVTGYVRAQKTCTLDGAPPSAFAPLAEESDAASDPGMLSAPYVAPPPVEPTPPKPVAPPAPSPVRPPGPGHTTYWGGRPPVDHAPGNNNAILRATSNKMAPGVTANCAQYYNVKNGDFCIVVAERFGTTFARLRELNTELNQECSNLWLGYDYCVAGLS